MLADSRAKTACRSVHERVRYEREDLDRAFCCAAFSISPKPLANWVLRVVGILAVPADLVATKFFS